MKMLIGKRTNTILLCGLFMLASSTGINAQTNGASTGNPAAKILASGKLPQVKQIDVAGLRKLLRAKGRPLLINFWATWCDPCREEFPDLVKFDSEFRGKIDFVTVSLDDLAEINRDVPKFLSEMKAEMPAFLLKTLDESAAITSVSTEWNGGLPFTILYNQKGGIAYSRQGKVKLEILRSELAKMLAVSTPAH